MPGAEAPLVGRDRSARQELAIGVVLIVVVAVGGIYLAYRPGAGPIDRFFTNAIGVHSHGPFRRVPLVRSPVAMVAGAVVLAALVAFRDRIRALAVVMGPLLALTTSEWVIKPLVGRTLGTSLSYPSGTVVATTALATALVLAAPVRWRAAAAVVAVLYTAWTCLAVVALQWHLPTDAAGGVAYGAGVVLMVDGLAWTLLGHRRLPIGRRGARSGGAGPPIAGRGRSAAAPPVVPLEVE